MTPFGKLIVPDPHETRRRTAVRQSLYCLTLGVVCIGSAIALTYAKGDWTGLVAWLGVVGFSALVIVPYVARDAA